MNIESDTRPPVEWEEYYGIAVKSPDGWNRNTDNWDEEWARPLSSNEFRVKAGDSAIVVVDNDKFMRRYLKS